MNTDKYALAPGVLFQKVVDETVILEPESGDYFTLDTVGTDMVEQIQQGKDVATMAQTLAEKYQASPEQIAADFVELAESMCQQGLLQKQCDNPDS